MYAIIRTDSTLLERTSIEYAEEATNTEGKAGVAIKYSLDEGEAEPETEFVVGGQLIGTYSNGIDSAFQAEDIKTHQSAT